MHFFLNPNPWISHWPIIVDEYVFKKSHGYGINASNSEILYHFSPENGILGHIFAQSQHLGVSLTISLSLTLKCYCSLSFNINHDEAEAPYMWCKPPKMLFYVHLLKVAFAATLWPQYSPRVAPIGQLFVPSPETSKWPFVVITTCLKNIPAMRQMPQMEYYITHSPLKLAFFAIFKTPRSLGSPSRTLSAFP